MANLGGMLIRPTDIALLLLIGITLTSGRLSKKAATFFAPFVALSLLLLLRAAVYSDTSAAVSAIKILYYATGSICMANIMLRALSDGVQTSKHWPVRAVIVYLLIMAALATSSVLTSLSFLNLSSIPSTVFNIMNSLFRFNFFGPSDVLEVRGVSFRNSMGGGFFAASLFFYLTNRRFSGVAAVLFVLAAASLSRSVWVAQAAFVLTHLAVASWRGRLATLVGVAIATAIGIYSSSVNEALIDRALSTSGRSGMVSLALPGLDQGVLLGTEAGAAIEMSDGIQKSVHNVPIALALEVGVLGGALALFIVLAILTLTAEQFLKTLSGRRKDSVKSSVIVSSGVFLALRPMVSASYENFYSIGEWGLFAVFIAAIISQKSVHKNNQCQRAE